MERAGREAALDLVEKCWTCKLSRIEGGMIDVRRDSRDRRPGCFETKQVHS